MFPATGGNTGGGECSRFQWVILMGERVFPVPVGNTGEGREYSRFQWVILEREESVPGYRG